MSDDEDEIRQLIQRWARAVHEGDLAGVLAEHDPGIVMFDVPPPHDGVRGLDAYRDTWPPFFGWQASGAVFEIVELDVTAGTDVAFAYALLRCNTLAELARSPATRLRLTVGLRNHEGRWVITHEHHSFAIDEPDRAEGEAAVRAIHARWSADTAAKDLDGLMADVDTDVVSYEHGGELQYVGRAAVREVCARGLDAPGEVSMDTPDLVVRVGDDLAVSWGLDHVQVRVSDTRTVESWSRATRVFGKRDGAWSMIHQHLSFPQREQEGD